MEFENLEIIEVQLPYTKEDVYLGGSDKVQG